MLSPWCPPTCFLRGSFTFLRSCPAHLHAVNHWNGCTLNALLFCTVFNFLSHSEQDNCGVSDPLEMFGKWPGSHSCMSELSVETTEAPRLPPLRSGLLHSAASRCHLITNRVHFVLHFSLLANAVMVWRLSILTWSPALLNFC